MNITDDDYLEALRELEELSSSGSIIPVIEYGNLSLVSIDNSTNTVPLGLINFHATILI